MQRDLFLHLRLLDTHAAGSRKARAGALTPSSGSILAKRGDRTLPGRWARARGAVRACSNPRHVVLAATCRELNPTVNARTPSTGVVNHIRSRLRELPPL